MSSNRKRCANRLGQTVGKGVRFFLYDSVPLFRWAKRAAFIIVVSLAAIQFFNGFTGAISLVPNLPRDA